MFETNIYVIWKLFSTNSRYSNLYPFFWTHPPFLWNLECFNVTLGVSKATEVSFFGGGWRNPCNLSGVQLARQFMKLNSFICLTYHLSDNLKIRHKFSPTTYTNQKFWSYLCYIHLSGALPSSKQNYVLCFS